MKTKTYLDNINSFLTNREVFFGKITGQSIFDRSAFSLYVKSVFNLSKVNLTLQERYDAVILIWEISYKIQDLIGSHIDPNDILFIDNFEEDDIRQVSNILYYTANWFSYGKEIDKEYLEIGSWE